MLFKGKRIEELNTTKGLIYISLKRLIRNSLIGSIYCIRIGLIFCWIKGLTNLNVEYARVNLREKK